MKKKIFSICLAFALLVPAVFMLTACGEPDNYYFTIQTPDHCNFGVSSFAADDKGTYLNKGNVFEGQVTIAPGYEVSGELVLKVNGEAVEWTSADEYGNYSFSFTPTEDFDIMVEGTIIESLYEVRFIEGEYADVSNLYIRFEGEEGQLVNKFLNSADAIQNFKYNDNLKFYVYTNGYNDSPLLSTTPGTSNEFYKDEAKNEYGYVYNLIIAEDYEIIFDGTGPASIFFATSENSSNLGSLYSNLLDMYIEDDALNIIFDDSITQETISQLTLTINGAVQDDISLQPGANTIAIKPAYEYLGDNYHPYNYQIDLNFYEFDEFDEIVVS